MRPVPGRRALRHTLWGLESGGALAFLEDHFERLLLAQVDEVVGRGLRLGHFGEVGEEGLNACERDAGEEVLR